MMYQMIERTKYNAIDVAKFVSALLVVCIHTGPLIDIDVQANFFLVQIISRIAVPLFFMISGFLLFKKIDLRREWNDYENLHILKHYLWRLFKIYLLWSIVYLPITYLLLQQGDGITIYAILRYLRDFIFTGSHYHLWFLPALMLAVVVVYYLLFHVHEATMLIISSGLYLLGMLGNIYGHFLLEIPFISSIYSLYLSIFSTTRNGLFFGVIFVALGAIFACKHVYLRKILRFMGFIVSFCLLVVEVFMINSNDPLISMYLMLVPCVSFLFLWLISINLSDHKIYKWLRVMSLLIYTSHIIFITVLSHLFPDMNSLLLYVSVIGMSCVFAYVFYVCSKYIKILKEFY